MPLTKTIPIQHIYFFTDKWLWAMLVGLLIFASTPETLAQTFGDSLELGPIEIEATRIAQPIDRQPTRINIIDSTSLVRAGYQTIAEALGEYSMLDLKSYGAGGSATISQRGLEADQTQILWNGIPINTPFLGLADLSLLDTDMISRIEVVPGNMSSAFGGRSLGGTVMLETELPVNNVSLSQSLGAYGYDKTLIEAGYRHKSWKMGVIGRRQRSSNDFSYVDPISNKMQQRENNSMDSRQLLAGISREKPGAVNFNSMIWINRSNNNVPGPVVAGTGSAFQEDRSLRWFGEAEMFVNEWKLNGKAYYSSYELDYIDPTSDINSQTFSWSSNLVVDTRRYFTEDFVFNASASGGLTGVRTNNYNSVKKRKQLSLQTNPVIRATDDIYLYPAIRYDYFTDFGGAASPSLGINWKPTTQWVFRLNAGYNFSPPTFNDLYWEPGGNPDLNPEQSKKVEGGLQWGRQKAWYGQHNVSLYYLNLENGIQWVNLGGIWTPKNVKQMVSRGITWQFSKSISLGQWNFRWGQLLDWTRSEITQARFGGDGIVGNQLAYVPKWKYKTNVTAHRSNFHVGGHYQWTGVRYTDNSHLSQLDPYLLVNLFAGYRKQLGSFNLHGRVRLNNLTDTDYQMIQWYPMPGRHMQFTATLNYNF